MFGQRFNSYWHFVSDALIIFLNSSNVCLVGFFIVTVIRLDRPSYSISNLIACHTCFSVALSSLMIIINTCFTLYSDTQGRSLIDGFCSLRGILFSILSLNMTMSFCTKAINRLRSIVLSNRKRFQTVKSFFVVLLIQFLLLIVLSIPIAFTDSVEYDFGSHLCLITINKSWQFFYSVVLYCLCIIIIAIIYLYILYYVINLPILERFRRKRQLALLRRIPILLVMILTPGFIYLFIIIYSKTFGNLPSEFFRVATLVESVAHLGAVTTIFVSNSRLRKQCYRRRSLPNSGQHFTEQQAMRRRQLTPNDFKSNVENKQTKLTVL